MSLLTDTDIKKILCTDNVRVGKNKIHIYPYEEECLTPVGYDVRIGNRYVSAIDARLYDMNENDQVTIKPGDTVLITTLEKVDMPDDRSISAFITSKVSIVAKGLSHISTNIDPDWKGNLLIAIHNPSCGKVILNHGDSLCTLNFIENKSPSTKECGKDSGRTDILLNQFVTNARESHTLEQSKIRKQHRRSLILKISTIIFFGVLGYFLFENTTGFVAMTAAGIALANYISWPRKES